MEFSIKHSDFPVRYVANYQRVFGNSHPNGLSYFSEDLKPPTSCVLLKILKMVLLVEFYNYFSIASAFSSWRLYAFVCIIICDLDIM